MYGLSGALETLAFIGVLAVFIIVIFSVQSAGL
jgi:hypothetical protein